MGMYANAIIELMKVNCTSCKKEVWSFIQSKEEYDTFICNCCKDVKNEISEKQSD